MPFAIGILLLMAAHLFGAPATQPAERGMKPELSLKVKLDAKPVKANEFAGVTLIFTNHTDKPLTILRPIDGADAGWRIVSYRWTTTDAHGQTPAAAGLGRCGNVNSLGADDFVTIPAGASVDVPGSFLISPNMTIQAKPGETYTSTLTYVFGRHRDDKGGKMGPDAPETNTLLDKTWEGTVESQPVTFTVTP